MFDISVKTALIIYIFTYGLSLLIITHLFFVAPLFKRTTKLFFLVFSCTLTGAILIYFRESIPLFLSVIVANFIILLGTSFIVLGVCEVTKIRVKWWIVISIIVSHLILFLIFTYYTFNTNARIIVQNTSSFLLIFYAFSVISVWKREDGNQTEMLRFVFALMMILLVYRTTGVFLSTDYGNDFMNFSQGSFGILLSGVTNSFMIIGLYSIMNSINRTNLLESQRSKTSLLSNLPGFAYRCNNDKYWTMSYVSQGFEIMTGYDKDDILQNKVISYEKMIHPDFREFVRTSWQTALQKNEVCVIEYKIRNKSNEELWVWEQGKGICENNECHYIEGYIANITERKKLEENLLHLSYRDSLTGLYNRRFIEEQISRLSASRILPISIVMSDVNGLKFINDSFGHLKGDEVLQEVAAIFKKSLREYELISRISGDEFIVVLENTSLEQVKSIVERVDANIRQIRSDVPISISMGYATKENQETSLEEVRKEAEKMMYQVKMYEKPSQQRKAVDAVMYTLFEKDKLSEAHSRKVSILSSKLAKHIGLTNVEVSLAETAGLLHDVGKIICEQRILESTTKLSEEEYSIIQQHCEIGYRILSGIPELKEVSEIVLNHHEKYDGTGYPNHKTGDEIPLISKIISVCDAYDAMIEYRPYKKSLTKNEALEELIRCKKTQFDPIIVDHFVNMMNK